MKLNFDIIGSSEDKQYANPAVSGFLILTKQSYFREMDIWADCRTHFRNCLLISYLFKVKHLTTVTRANFN